MLLKEEDAYLWCIDRINLGFKKTVDFFVNCRDFYILNWTCDVISFFYVELRVTFFPRQKLFV